MLTFLFLFDFFFASDYNIVRVFKFSFLVVLNLNCGREIERKRKKELERKKQFGKCIFETLLSNCKRKSLPFSCTSEQPITTWNMEEKFWKKNKKNFGLILSRFVIFSRCVGLIIKLFWQRNKKKCRPYINIFWKLNEVSELHIIKRRV